MRGVCNGSRGFTACVWFPFPLPLRPQKIRVLSSNAIKAAMERPEAEVPRKPSGDTHPSSIDFKHRGPPPEGSDRQGKKTLRRFRVLTDDVDGTRPDSARQALSVQRGPRAQPAGSGIGVGYRKGAAKPDVRTGTSLNKALLNASRLPTPATGPPSPSGRSTADRGPSCICSPVGIKVASGRVPGSADMVANGESELGSR